MTKPDLTTALRAIEPATKAGKLREVMPIIEQQLKAGVTRQAILDVLEDQGIVLTLQTLKSYLYRYRKTVQAGTVEAPKNEPKPQSVARGLDEKSVSVSYDTDTQDEEPTAPMVHLGPNQLSQLMNPGDDQNASDLDRYENAARTQKRTRK
ncbi:TraD protein [Pseudomonas helleri]|uniref:TraD protein n=1 Tax=Pseudomonas helleri TaxID=1608996 RepID=A0A6G1W931_9PSED|nr:TraD protein [Pseudomonas helleri]MQT27544.1 TraD protein [Pseudomonas helleri]MQU18932.1 TraD protein [Pseudomonas helleri]